MAIEVTDSHTHLDAEEFDKDRDEVIARAIAAGVTRIVTIGAAGGLESAHKAIALTERFPSIWASAGVHPQDAGKNADLKILRELLSHPRVVAVGETGLDFFRDYAPHDVQETYFRKQVELAIEVKKPLIIHSRQAGEECFKILAEMGAKEVGGVFHCYAENAEFAKRLQSINFLVSFPGTITFKKAEELRKIVSEIPLSQMMVETDAPYMAPEPHRGKRCESSFVVETAKTLAKIKNISFEEIAASTTETARKFFRI